ncbi:antitoxin Xre/MbcA/ParS toxin-binding domain-containing protein [Bradyrhizobium paxllaeri]|uniref:antitoxin Xre/MbcA/ParS toxin-binding domain-containing protein n=1 Tax=Bradyrhizobium paxllaeri TaxID=190148 RepID=UPI000810BE3D|nr:antitoxin Xre/MbcA/ParS toxin-binding domain-containing protein [Bradyrhizobium paxllaeri]
MNAYLPTIPTGNALLVFILGLLVGTFVIHKFCLDQFGKSIAGNDDNCPWKFVILRYQTTPSEYLTGYSIYFGLMMTIFLATSIIGPGPFFQILKAVTAAATQSEMPTASPAAETSLQNYPTFPILVAFYIVGLNPNLPKALDFEISIRGFAHRMAYIPKNIDRLLNYMRFSDMDLQPDKLADAWNAIDLDRPASPAPDLKSACATFDRVVLLYARAATLAGDASFDDSKDLAGNLDLEIFRKYRAEIQNVGTNLLAIYARLSDLPAPEALDRRRAVLTIQRDLIKNLEWLYVIFAGAVTAARGNGRIFDRLSAAGFVSPYPPAQRIPWDPILKATGAAAFVVVAACLLAINTFLGTTEQTQIPTTTDDVLQLLMVILVVHIFAIGQSLALRAKLLGRNAYYAESGNGRAEAYVQIFLKCWITSLLLNLVLYSPNLIAALSTINGDHPTVTQVQLLWQYFSPQLAWATVPAICGVMTSYTLDRPAGTRFEQALSGGLQASAMTIAAMLAAELTFSNISIEYREFLIVLYGGLGFVLGAMLPKGIRRHWDVQESYLPDKITVLRNAVRQYFHDIQQFSEWLNARSDKLDGKRPLDVLSEDNGLQQLTLFVSNTRQRVAGAMR